jgi:hypothetical protein
LRVLGADTDPVTVTIRHLDAHGHTMLRLLRWTVPHFEQIEGGATVETANSQDLIMRLHRVDPGWRRHLVLSSNAEPGPRARAFAHG